VLLEDGLNKSVHLMSLGNGTFHTPNNNTYHQSLVWVLQQRQQQVLDGSEILCHTDVWTLVLRL